MPEENELDFAQNEDTEASDVKKKKNKNERPGEITRERKRWGFLGIPWTFTKYILMYSNFWIIQYRSNQFI